MSNKLVTGIAIGAVTGAALSMLDRSTRETTVRKVKHFVVDVQYYAYNRQEIVDKIQSTTSSVQSMYNTFMKDKDFYLEKINEIQELTPQVKEIVLETKEVLTAGIDKAKEKKVQTESVIHL